MSPIISLTSTILSKADNLVPELHLSGAYFEKKAIGGTVIFFPPRLISMDNYHNIVFAPSSESPEDDKKVNVCYTSQVYQVSVCLAF